MQTSKDNWALADFLQVGPGKSSQNLWLRKAKELLKTTDGTFSEKTFKATPQLVGHFTSIFKKQHGGLPSVFSRTNNKLATNE